MIEPHDDPAGVDRRAIADYLLNRRSRYYQGHGTLLFCFPVKIGHLDITFEHLLDLYRRMGYGPDKVSDPGWVKEARQRYEITDPNDLYALAVEDARLQVSESNVFRHLDDGTPVAVDYAFVGRSGGWVALTEFEGLKLTDPERLRCLFHGDTGQAGDDGEDYMDDDTLGKLYRLVRMLEQELSGTKTRQEVEYQAAFALFEVFCSDIPTAADNLGAGI